MTEDLNGDPGRAAPPSVDCPPRSEAAQALAERCADAMWAEDRASQGLGMAIEGVGPGHATLSMTVTEAMINGHEICHGGLIFTLADSAFAFACNAYNKVTVAQHCDITFLAPARLGDRLVAVARERALAGRNGIYDISVTNQDGTLVAEFRGISRTIQGSLVPGTSNKPHPDERAAARVSKDEATGSDAADTLRDGPGGPPQGEDREERKA